MASRIKAAFKIGAAVYPRYFVQGYPVGASVDTRLVVREQLLSRQGNRYRCERDDGRQGSWWIDEPNLRPLGGY